jgi:putative ABC transport system permease protein
MTLSAVARKSLSDVTRRRGRAFLAIAALAIAVASLGLFALPTLMNRTMNGEITANKLADMTMTVKPLPLTAGQVRALRHLPNVTAFDPEAIFSTLNRTGWRTVVIGKASFVHQTVDAVTVTTGSAPGPNAVLSDAQNAATGRGVGGVGGWVRLRAGDGNWVALPVSGQARNLNGGQNVVQNTVAELSGTPGYTQLEFRLHDASAAAARRTVTTIRQYLETVPGFTGFSDLPQIRSAGDWPGKSRFSDLTGVLYVVTLLALLGALVLLSSTISTIVSEQTPEIATMKAIGAGRRQIRRVYLRTAMLLGGLGGIAGAALGILLAWALTSYFASSLYAISASFSVDLPVVVASVAVGVFGPPLAALPAVRRAAKLPLAAAPCALPAPHRPDRVAERHPPPAAEHHDGASGRACRRHAARVPLAGHQRRQHRE